MSIIVEVGTIVAGAESYCTVAETTTYHTNRGNTLWTGTDAVKEAALRKATAYLDGYYRQRFKGQKVYPLTQPLEWPRVGVRVVTDQIYYDVPPSFYDSNYSGFLAITTIPQRLKDACCELALRALSGDLATDLTAGIKREKIDVIETEYFQGATQGTAYKAVDQLLSDFLKPSGSADVLRG
jgi:phage gp36-like protein